FQTGERNFHAVNDYFAHRPGGGTSLLAAIDGESHESGDATTHPEIGIAGIYPAAHPLVRAVGEGQVDVDDHTVVIQRNRHRDGFGLGLGWSGWFRSILRIDGVA